MNERRRRPGFWRDYAERCGWRCLDRSLSGGIAGHVVRRVAACASTSTAAPSAHWRPCSGDYRWPSADESAPPPNFVPGHVFVVQGDVTQMNADAVLVPSRSINSPKWFPDGPPDGLRRVDAPFTVEDRVHPAPGAPPGQPEVWLGWFFYEGEGVPSVDWFVSAAEQYLERAFARFVRRGRLPLCDRQLPLLALPVVGTGNSGAKPIAGSVVSALLLILHAAADHPVDVCLVTKSARMLSAAQSVAAPVALSGLTATSHGRALGPRLLSAAERLAELAMSGQLVQPPPASRTNNMPGCPSYSASSWCSPISLM